MHDRKSSDFASFTEEMLENPMVRAGYDMSKANADVARLIKTLRTRAELSQGEFAQLMQMSIDSFIQLEAGKGLEQISATRIAYIARLCGSRLVAE